MAEGGRLLRRAAKWFHVGGIGRVSGKKGVVVEAAIHATGNFRGFGSESGPAALQEDDHHDTADVGLGVRGEPSVTGSGAGAGSGLSQDFLFIEIDSEAAGCAVADG